jgi:hypothetical protein
MNPDIDPIAALTASISRQRLLAADAHADLVAATPALIAAIRYQSGQSAKVEKILWACWNDDHQVNLCDTLAGLDTAVTVAVLALIGARAHLGGEADDMLRKIIDDSGSQPPIQPIP